MKKIKISAVSYMNTLPFVYGLEHSGFVNKIDLHRDVPSTCAQKLIDNVVDIGLIPVAAIRKMKESHIITDYCIGADNEVKSVLLLSDVPLEKIEKVYLDYQSRTSVALVQVLAKHYWNISPHWIPAKENYETQIERNTAGVIIGDRTFFLPKKFNYVYDLAQEWINFTGLPFVFACWVANKQIDFEFIKEFNVALKHGIDNLDLVSEEFYRNNPTKKIDIYKYFTENVNFDLNENKRKGLELFFNYLNTTPLL